MKFFADIPDWELRVYYARHGGELKDFPTGSRETIDGSLGSVKSSIAADQLRAALMIGWATIEAIGRSLSPKRSNHAEGSRALMEALAYEGFVTADQADSLRRLSALRNSLAHGGSDQHLSRQDLAELIEILEAVRRMAGAAKDAPRF